MVPRRPLSAIASAALLAACAAPGPPSLPLAARSSAAAGAALTLDEVGTLRRARDFFTLRDRLEGAPATGALPDLVARALVEHAFNRPAASSAAITSALRDPDLPDSLDLLLREVDAANHLRRHDYAAGLAVADALIRRHSTTADSARLADIRNLRKILAALADAPPQTARADGPSVLPLERGRIPVAFGDSARSYVFDTGANISTVMRSEAEVLGMDIRAADLEVGTSTDTRIRADVAVATAVRIGAMEFRNVAFLVVDDAALTFGDFRIPGIIGFPVIEALGEIRLRPQGEVRVPVEPSVPLVRNLALDGFTPLTVVRWEGERLICRLDTGAGDTDFYQSFFRRFRGRLDAAGTPRTRRMGGVGGIRELPVLELYDLTLAVGDTTVALDSAGVLTTSIVRTEDEDFLDCNIGHDVLDQFTEYIINFRDMAFLLR